MKRLILAGAGHGHVNLLRKMISDRSFLKKFEGTKITLITDCRYQYYSGMIPGFLAGDYMLEEIRFDVKYISDKLDINYTEEKIVEIDSNKKTVVTDFDTYEFDYISMNLGSETRKIVVSPEIKNIVNVKPVSNIVMIKNYLDKDKYKRIAIVGSGASSIELALSIGYKYKDVKISIISSSGYVLNTFNESTRKKVTEVLNERNINVYLSKKIDKIMDNYIEFENKKIDFDYCIVSTGVKGQDIVYTGYEVTDDNFLTVDSFLFANNFSIATGDMINIKEYPYIEKAGVIAIRQGPVLINNILSMIGDKNEVKRFVPKLSYLQIINLGGKRAIVNFGNFSNKGRVSWIIKNYIDKKYMKL